MATVGVREHRHCVNTSDGTPWRRIAVGEAVKVQRGALTSSV
ncbi:MAG: hypothetical protein QOE76_2595 [Frankiales bacterium]|nr:hypothetical protein [Frankiales bacterium]